MSKRILTTCVCIVLTLALLGGMPGLLAAQTTANETASPIVLAAATPASKDLARFDEATGMFSVYYPKDFTQIERLGSESALHGYSFANEDASATLAVGFMVMSNAAMSDAEWSMIFSVIGPEMLIQMLGPRFVATYEEVTREEGGTGVHTLYWEGEAADDGMQSALRLEESEGVLAVVALAAPVDLWAERADAFAQSVASLEWSPDLARDQDSSDEPVVEEDDALPESDIVIDMAPEDEPTEEADVLPTEEAAPDEVDSLELDDFINPTETPPDETPVEETDVIEPEQEESAGGEVIDFEDPNGVFVLSYPADFEDSDPPAIDGDNYVFAAATPDGIRYLGASFTLLAESELSNAQWRAAVNAMVDAVLNNVGSDAVEVYRTAGKPGQHWLYLEAESQDNAARAFYYLEEAEGVLAIVLGQVPSDEWPDWESKLLDAVSSFQWSPSAAREVLGESVEPPPDLETEPEEIEPTPTRRPKPTEEPAADTGIPAGKGGLVMLNCRSDVITVDVIPDAIFQELGPKQGEECFRGAPIFLNPGEHILKAAIAGMPSQGEATVAIVAGQWFEFTWY